MGGSDRALPPAHASCGQQRQAGDKERDQVRSAHASFPRKMAEVERSDAAATRAEELATLKEVRQSLQAFDTMVNEVACDLNVMASNYEQYAEINRKWEQLMRTPPRETQLPLARAMAPSTSQKRD